MTSIVVTADDVRLECRDTVDRLAKLIAPGGNQKERRGKISDMTGIPARRIKDYALGAIKEPPAHQVRTLENALRVARALARESALRLDELETERAEIDRFIAARHGRVASHRSAAGAHDRWQRVGKAGARNRTVGEG